MLFMWGLKRILTAVDGLPLKCSQEYWRFSGIVWVSIGIRFCFQRTKGAVLFSGQNWWPSFKINISVKDDWKQNDLKPPIRISLQLVKSILKILKHLSTWSTICTWRDLNFDRTEVLPPNDSPEHLLPAAHWSQYGNIPPDVAVAQLPLRWSWAHHTEHHTSPTGVKWKWKWIRWHNHE